MQMQSPYAGSNPQRLVLWYEKPATQWVEALPVGNGRLGAMVFGGTASERLQLNEDTLYAGGPYDPNNRDALAALPEARRLIFEGQIPRSERSGRRENDGAADQTDALPTRRGPASWNFPAT